jgi:hypothetical protein
MQTLLEKYSPLREGEGVGSSAPTVDPGASAAPTPSTPDSGAAPTSSEPSPSSNGGDDDFSFPLEGLSMGNDGGDSIVVPAEPAASPPAAPAGQSAGPTPPAAQPQVQPPAQPPVAQPAAPQPAASAPAAPVVQGPQPSLDPNDPAAVAGAIKANFATLVQAAAEQEFALSPEEVQALEDNAVEAVPRLLARTHLTAVAVTMAKMAQVVPQMITKEITKMRNAIKAEQQFYGAFPQIQPTNPQHQETVAKVWRTYRQLNPSVPREQAIKDVGNMVVQMLGLGAAPAPQPQVNGQNLRPAQPFVPAPNGRGGPMPVQPAPDPWLGLGADFDES